MPKIKPVVMNRLSRYEKPLCWAWILCVVGLFSGWLLYCVTPDRQIGVWRVVGQLRESHIEKFHLAQDAVHQGDVNRARVLMHEIEADTRYRSNRNVLGSFRARVLLDLAELYEDQGETSDAARWLREAVKVDKGNYQLHLALARVLRLEGETKEAEAHYLQAFQINPNNLKVITGLVGFYVEVENFVKARDAYTRYLDALISVVGVVRTGDQVQEFSLPVDGKQHDIPLVFETPITTGTPLMLEAGSSQLNVVNILYYGRPDLRSQGQPALLAEQGAVNSFREVPPTWDVYTIDEKIFDASEYHAEVVIPNMDQEVGHIILQGWASKDVDERLIQLFDAALAGLDDDAGRKQLRVRYSAALPEIP